MKRIIILALAATALIATTGCVPGWPQIWNDSGFWDARNGAQVTVDNRTHQGVDANELIAPWNATAGRQLLVAYGRGDPNGANAQIRFEIMSPICKPLPDGGCDRRASWVDPKINPDGSFEYCTIWFDPWVPAEDFPAPWRTVMRHEMGHCLGFMSTDGMTDRTNPEYQGAVSYFGFGFSLPERTWWQEDDRNMLFDAGYRRQR